MTLHINQRGDRIVCRWTEPVKFRMAKWEGILDKVRTITLSLDRRGKLASRDRKRHAHHPLFSHAQRFRDKLAEMNFFSEKRIVCACERCGSTDEVLPHYDPDQATVTWHCADPVRCHTGR